MLKNKKIFLILTSILFCFSINSFAKTASDIPNNHWAKSYIENALISNWAYVDEQGNFNPDAKATREHVIYMIINAWDIAYEKGTVYSRLLTKEKYPDLAVSFSDYQDGTTIANDCKTEVELSIINEIIEGYEDNGIKTIKPKGNITRAEMATVMTRIANIELDNTKAKKFKDNIDGWAVDYVDTAVKMGLIEGYENGTFMPGNSITNAEVVTMLSRWLKQANANYTEEEKRLISYEFAGDGVYIVDELGMDSNAEENNKKWVKELTEKYNFINNTSTDTFENALAIEVVKEYFKTNYSKLGYSEVISFKTTDNLCFALSENIEDTSTLLIRGVLSVKANGATKNVDVEILLQKYAHGWDIVLYNYL